MVPEIDIGELTKEERLALDGLSKLAKRWPKSLWLFSANGELHVMRCDEEGERSYLMNGCCDQRYIVATVDIPNDGGDW